MDHENMTIWEYIFHSFIIYLLLVFSGLCYFEEWLRKKAGSQRWKFEPWDPDGWRNEVPEVRNHE